VLEVAVEVEASTSTFSALAASSKAINSSNKLVVSTVLMHVNSIKDKITGL
jgi:hypothetical protein